MATESDRLTKQEVALLTQQFKAGDQEAGWRLVLSVRGWLVKLCSGFVPTESIEDAVSEIGLVIFNSLKNYNPDKSTISGFSHMIWTRRRQRILAKYVTNKTLGSVAQLDDEADIPEPALDEFATKVAFELEETSMINDVAKLAYRAMLKELNKAEIAEAIELANPGYFDGRDICCTWCQRKHIETILSQTSLLLAERLGVPAEKLKLAHTGKRRKRNRSKQKEQHIEQQ